MAIELIIKVAIEKVDPLRLDPHDVAELLVEEYNEYVTANGFKGRTAELLSAEWGEFVPVADEQQPLPEIAKHVGRRA